jgi:hypothetical protein
LSSGGFRGRGALGVITSILEFFFTFLPAKKAKKWADATSNGHQKPYFEIF